MFTLVNAAARGRLIALLFHSLESSSKMILPFPEHINPNLVITLWAGLRGPRSEHSKELIEPSMQKIQR